MCSLVCNGEISKTPTENLFKPRNEGAAGRQFDVQSNVLATSVLFGRQAEKIASLRYSMTLDELDPTLIVSFLQQKNGHRARIKSWQ